MIYACTLDATALSTAHRPRASVTARGGIHMRKADGYQPWLNAIRWQVRRPKGWPLDAMYAVTVVLHAADENRRDADNVCKPVLDALQWPTVRRRKAKEPLPSTLWRDDCQVRVCEVVIGAPAARPRLLLVARVVDADWIAEHAAKVVSYGE